MDIGPLTCLESVGAGALVPCKSNFAVSDLGHAMTICVDHVRPDGTTIMIPPPRAPQFISGWEACTKVWNAWQKSEEARRQREYEAEVERQRRFVNEVARKLK